MASSVKDMLAAANSAVPRIQPADLRDRMSKGDVVVVDVRDAPELATGGLCRDDGQRQPHPGVRALAGITRLFRHLPETPGIVRIKAFTHIAKSTEGGYMAVEQKVKQIIVEQLGVDETQVDNNASFVEDLGADSLDIVELVMAFEEAFEIEIPDEDAEKIATVKDAIDYIESRTAAKK